ncbi:MAG: hypothetical protein KDI54_19635 [Gammaproteobacteria bacterium]|nr:hypothetical protein [Gammaproteobacteria bacterium]
MTRSNLAIVLFARRFRILSALVFLGFSQSVWSATWLGNSAQATLIGEDDRIVVQTVTQTPFTAGPVVVTDPGIEFEGLLRTTGYADDRSYPYDSRVKLDIFDSYFTIGITADNEWTSTGIPGGPRVGGFGITGSSTLFSISLSDLVFSDQVIFDPSLSSGFFGTTDVRSILSTGSSVDIGFGWLRDGTTYGFSIVPIPAAFPLFGSALGLMGFISWRRKRNT